MSVTEGELGYHSALPVSQVTDGDTPNQEADIERGLVHVHQPCIRTHQVKLEQTHKHTMSIIKSSDLD